MSGPQSKRYVALLRGINVGGKNKIEMKRLRRTFERAGMSAVATYINSGNVIFNDRGRPRVELSARLEKAVAADFGLEVPVLLRTREEIDAVHAALPPDWSNDSAMKCDVLFLWEEIDNPDVLDQLPLKPELVTVRYLPGTVLVGMDRAHVARSGLNRLVGSSLYRAMTIRNVNTLRRIHGLLAEQEQ